MEFQGDQVALMSQTERSLFGLSGFQILQQIVFSTHAATRVALLKRIMWLARTY
jgi:hypothetical protein